MSDPARRLTVCGSFSPGNTGDEAVRLALQDLIRHLGLEVELDLVGPQDEQPEASPVIAQGPQDEARRAALAGQPVLVAGGRIVSPDDQSVLFRCAPMLRRRAAPTSALWAASVEPGLDYPFHARRRIRAILEDFDLITTRDLLSLRVLREIMPRLAAECIGDCVLWLEPAAGWPSGVPHPDRFIVVTLLPCWTDNVTWHQWLAGQLLKISADLKATVLFIPFSGPREGHRAMHRAVALAMRAQNSKADYICLEDELGPREIAAMIQRAQLVVSMRLHGCVLAYARQVPFIGLATHPKLAGFAETVGWRDCILPEVLPAAQGTVGPGFTFDESGLAACDLYERAIAIVVEHRDYEQLAHYRQRLAETFRRFVAGR